ncbi:type II toxin-antitoxin system CcdA family antitoxin [Amaricoccus sp.]|uniref:type II toxin-antitoxin system CcdA family antitoxin n=1 Tax=Amaricoccus sp. TaxID=1872485 RepID=UPI001B4301C3|nr:type II toxin-antitoxin system CcdA family antitoxin [Amaricoccus sp.]MBP7002533.1 type II toxin-antitoxin system CcdA family antitoxin [Amaricoccus sp.]
MPNPRRKSRTNITVDQEILDSARAYDLNVSLISEQALAAAVRTETARRWETENAAAIAERADWIERHGLPLADLQIWKP